MLFFVNDSPEGIGMDWMLYLVMTGMLCEELNSRLAV